MTDPLGNTWAYAYDANGRLSLTTVPTGETMAYAYDPRGLLTGVAYGDGTAEKFAYDAVGNLVRAVSADADLSFGYDAAGRQTTTYWAEFDKTTTYGYDASGRRTRLTDPEGRVFTYRYDAAGQLTAFVDPDGNESRLAYDGAGRLREVAYPNGVTETRVYDPAGRLAELHVRRPEGLLESYTYTRDARGFAVRQVEEDGATTSWAYDAAGRLVGVEYPADKIQAIRDAQGATIERVRPATDEDEGQPDRVAPPAIPGTAGLTASSAPP